MADVTLKVGGQKYSGWTSVSVTRSIESISGSFSLNVSERWANQDQPWPINEGDECSVLIGDEVVITGFVDSRKPSYGPGAHSLSIDGRDKTADLVDCSALVSQYEYKNFDVFKLAQKLCKPFNITVSQLGVTVPGKTLVGTEKLHIDPGETVFNVLEHAARIAGVLLISDGEGGVIITQPGTERAVTELVEGQNIISAEADFTVASRFYHYIALGQHQATDAFFGAEAAQIKGEAFDPNVTRQARVLVIRPEGNVTPAFAKLRAQWEATVRAARSNSVKVVVQGWTQGNGALWPVNALVHVKSPQLRIDGDMLIASATYSFDESEGTRTELSLKPPGAFKPEPSVERDGLWKEISKGV